jgi:2-haloacid dehalogenase
VVSYFQLRAWLTDRTRSAGHGCARYSCREQAGIPVGRRQAATNAGNAFATIAKEVADALRKLRDAGFRLVTLTNSGQQGLEQQLRNAGLSEFFERNFSVDATRRYKPAPEPYRMVASEVNVKIDRLCLVAAHAWDVLGAMQAGCTAAFVSRPGKVLFPLTPEPDIIGSDLTAVVERIIETDK